MAIVLLIVVLALAGFCAAKEGAITGRYKANKVYGRFTAYLALDFTMVGIVGILGLFVPALKVEDLPILGAIVCLALGILLYLIAYLKCPQTLKKMCIPCMIISGLGVTIKIAVFFLPFVWKLDIPETSASYSIPEVVQDSDGNSCRTRIDGDFVYIMRPDGTEVSERIDYLGKEINPKEAVIGGVRVHWQ